MDSQPKKARKLSKIRYPRIIPDTTTQAPVADQVPVANRAPHTPQTFPVFRQSKQANPSNQARQSLQPDQLLQSHQPLQSNQFPSLHDQENRHPEPVPVKKQRLTLRQYPVLTSTKQLVPQSEASLAPHLPLTAPRAVSRAPLRPLQPQQAPRRLKPLREVQIPRQQSEQELRQSSQQVPTTLSVLQQPQQLPRLREPVLQDLVPSQLGPVASTAPGDQTAVVEEEAGI